MSTPTFVNYVHNRNPPSAIHLHPSISSTVPYIQTFNQLHSYEHIPFRILLKPLGATFGMPASRVTITSSCQRACLNVVYVKRFATYYNPQSYAYDSMWLQLIGGGLWRAKGWQCIILLTFTNVSMFNGTLVWSLAYSRFFLHSTLDVLVFI